ncbi:MAG: NADH-quinone oxidoreductase subunit L [Planctomycetota bacterium]
MEFFELDKVPLLLLIAWLAPLASFAMILLIGPRMGKAGHSAGYVATGAILLGFVLSLSALVIWVGHHPVAAAHHGEAEHGGETEHLAETEHGGQADEHGATELAAADHVDPLVGDWYTLGEFGSLKITVGYYIDALTILMFVMVTLVAGCIHIYSFGYMHEELEEVTDPLVTLSDGQLLKRAGRFHRFYQYFSLFSFSMFGLVIAGNVAMVFVFWELVGICSYLLIGFYHERKSASTAANKAFIVNRVGDFGMLIGMMALWSGLGTFAFDEIFDQVRPLRSEHALTEGNNSLVVPDGMVRLAARDEIEQIYRTAPDAATAQTLVAASMPTWRAQNYGYWLLVIAGLGIFCGCVGKSAQFPLHVWLPDAMEGPTPVSALIHAATMVAAGVYLVGRFYPVFTPEVLLVIACVGCITLFLAATIAITATDIKRVLAYSTVSQLGYMMFALGLGGWVAGLFHLLTHAFFKSLLFLCSGSVIHACHTNEMPEMGGLRKKMPWTAGTMLVGCLAISGAGVPLLIGLSGFHSKDSILAQAFSFATVNQSSAWVFFTVASLGATITAFYMFRLWYMTFAGPPRDEHVYAHAHESPKVMYVPLVVLAFFAVVVGWQIPFTGLGVPTLLEQARPLGTAEGGSGGLFMSTLEMPAEHLSHEAGVHVPVSLIAFSVALAGFVIATLYYGTRKFDPEAVRRRLAPVHRFLLNKWWFDELYHALFVRPAHWIARAVAGIDRHGIDWLADSFARWTRELAQLDDWIDRLFVDRLIDLTAAWTYRFGLGLRSLQTGNLRQYVMLLVVGTVALFALVSIYWRFTAGY